MLITWNGLACFRIGTNNLTIVIDPYDPTVGLKLARQSADIVLSTSDRPAHCNLAAINGEPFRITGPGEYEVKGVFIWGHAFDQPNDPPRRTTAYVLETEDITLAHLGDLSVVLTEEQLDRLEGVDVLLVPVGGHAVLDAKKAAALISEIEPRIVIPMYYSLPGIKQTLDPVAKFTKELGVVPTTTEKFRVAKKDLPQEETKLVIVTP